MLFVGNYVNKVDEKGRVSLPSSFRNTLKKWQLSTMEAPRDRWSQCGDGSDQGGMGDGGMSSITSTSNTITRGGKKGKESREDMPEIYMMPAMASDCLRGGGEDWVVSMAGEPRGDRLSPEEARKKRAILGSMHLIVVDGTGRFVLPRTLREIAYIRDQAMFIGSGQYFEVWNPEGGTEELLNSLAAQRSEGSMA